MKEKSVSQQYLSNILKQTGHAATKAVDDNAEKVVDTSLAGIAIVNNSAPKGIHTIMVNSSLGIFSAPSNKQRIADEVKKIANSVDEKIDGAVDETIKIVNSTM